MTTFLWDDSHYGEPPTSRDGIDGYTHKLTDGYRFYEDVEYKLSMERMRDFGTPVLGPYHVLWGNASIDAQAEWFVSRATALTPWWKDFEYWTWQIDSEPFSYLVRPTVAQCNYFAKCIHDLTYTPYTSILGYLPLWSYGAQISQLTIPWWQSAYGSNPVGPYRDIYPGDASARWNGPIPMPFLQYGSNAIIAGQRTSDANAFRGDLNALKKFLRPATPGGNPDMPIFVQDSRPNAPVEMAGAVYISDGPIMMHLKNPTQRDFALKCWGKTLNDIIKCSTDDQFAAVGVDVEKLIPKNDNGGGTPTPPQTFNVVLSGGGSISLTGTATQAPPQTNG